jgi:RNA polymerase sigma-70 factor (ECF subfamily)
MAIITLYDNIKSNRLNKLDSSVKTYLFAIGKNKILEQRKSSYRFVHKSDHEVLDVPEIGKWEDDDYEESLQMVEKSLHKLGEPCRTLLELYYFHNMTMEEIARRLQHKNTDTSKNVKYKCLMRLRKIFHTDFVRTNKHRDE